MTRMPPGFEESYLVDGVVFVVVEVECDLEAVEDRAGPGRDEGRFEGRGGGERDRGPAVDRVRAVDEREALDVVASVRIGPGHEPFGVARVIFEPAVNHPYPLHLRQRVER